MPPVDDNIVVDLTNYKDRVGARVTPGRYTVIVEDTEKDKSSNGNPMVNVWLRIVGGQYDGATIVDRLVMTEGSLFRVVGFMQAIGLPTPKKRLQLNVRSWVGKRLAVDVDDGNPYQGRIKSEVRGYNPIEGEQGGAGGDVADLDDLEAGAGASGDAGTSVSNGEAPPPSDKDAVDGENVDLDKIEL